MACPNLKNGPKNRLGPLGVKKGRHYYILKCAKNMMNSWPISSHIQLSIFIFQILMSSVVVKPCMYVDVT
jgi:hypothetical protein